MSAFIDENTQFVDTGGNPIVNGKIYIGTKGANPKTSAITIYSNRALSSVLANPQTLNSAGRSTNKIFIPDVYSFQVDNAAGVQQIQDLDAGSGSSGGLIILSSVQGTNTITAVASPSVTSYVDGQIYVFQAANANTGATTINIDSVGAKAIVDSAGALSAGDIATGRNSTLIYNSTDDNFELQVTVKVATGGNLYIAETANAAADVAGSIQLWNKNTGTGLLHVTDDAGTDKEVSLVGNNIFINETSAAAGDTAGVGQIWVDDAVPNTLMFTNDAGTDEQLSGLGYQSVVQVVNVQTGAVATGTTVMPSDDSIPQSNEGDQYMQLAISPQSASNKLKIEVVWFGADAASNTHTLALFQDSTANALAAVELNATADWRTVDNFSHYMTAGTVSETTFKVRVGSAASTTTTFNGLSGGRKYGGVAASSITITEYTP